MKELWKKVQGNGFERFWEVSSEGRLRKIRDTERRNCETDFSKTYPEIRPPKIINCKGEIRTIGGRECVCRPSVWMETHRVRQFHYLDELVASAFLSNPNGHGRILHRNGDVFDCRAENLEWTDSKDGLKAVKELD